MPRLCIIDPAHGSPYSSQLAGDDIRDFIPWFQWSFFIDFKSENIFLYTINFNTERNLGVEV